MNDLDRQRWERLVLWLREQHGLDVSEERFHVEVREVEGARSQDSLCPGC